MKLFIKSLLFAALVAICVPATVFAAPENHEEFARQYMPESQAIFERFRKDCAETRKLRDELVSDLRVMNVPAEASSGVHTGSAGLNDRGIELKSRPLDGNQYYVALTQKIEELETREIEWVALLKDVFFKHKAAMITAEKLAEDDAVLAKKSLAWENGALKNMIKKTIERSNIPATVKIPNKPYAFGKYEVTQSQYAVVMGTHYSIHVGPTIPAENVSWNDADTFCKLLTLRERVSGRISVDQEYRLPTAKEWEHACADNVRYERNDAQLAKIAWYYRNSQGKAHPVGLKNCNEFGLYDMFGNVGEWTSSDCREYRIRNTDGNRMILKGGDYMGSHNFGREFNANRGSMDNRYGYSRSGFGYASPTVRYPVFGFRVVLETKNAPVNTFPPEVIRAIEDAKEWRRHYNSQVDNYKIGSKLCCGKNKWIEITPEIRSALWDD